MELAYLYNGGLMSRVVTEIQQKMHEVAAGSVPHAENVLGALLIKLSSLLAVRSNGSAEKAKTEEEELIGEVDVWYGQKKKKGKRGL